MIKPTLPRTPSPWTGEASIRQLQTVRDLAILFRRHQNTIYKWIIEDRLFPHAFQVKHGWYVPESDVRRLIRQGHAAALMDGPPTAAPAGTRSALATPARIPYRAH